MGVDEVHRVLLDVFPQVDYRVLRAVAFAHAKDPDAAVEVVLVEVIPSLSKQLTKSSSPNVSGSISEAVDATVTNQLNATFLESVHGSEDGSLNHVEKGENSSSMSPYMSSYIDSSGESEDEEAISLRKGKSNARSDEVSASLQCSRLLSHSLACREANGDVNLQADWEDSEQSLSAVDRGNHEEQLCENGFSSETNSAVQECLENSQEGSIQLVVGPNIEEPEESSINAVSKKDLWTSEMVDLQDESTMNTMVPRSGYVCSINLLEDLIEEARNNKKTLVSGMESVVSLAREVELREKAAEQAKVEATRGCVDIHNKVQELKLALQRAKEANDMHAGEVYAEKAVLTTEAKELQSRLLSLSEERDRSLRVLDEMRESLEVRLAAAEKEIEEAEHEKLEKEASVREALTFQERIMEEVVQESRLLKQEAEENTKLQEFLMDRGRIVDMLQGEISVKCQDVKLLKEKFDSRVPLSTSLFSSQTICILGSSSRSSSRSMSPPEHVPELTGSCDKLQKSEELVDLYETLQRNAELDSYRTLEEGARVADSLEPMKASAKTPVNKHLSYGEEKASNDTKVLVDDGWEFCDNI